MVISSTAANVHSKEHTLAKLTGSSPDGKVSANINASERSVTIRGVYNFHGLVRDFAISVAKSGRSSVAVLVGRSHQPIDSVLSVDAALDHKCERSARSAAQKLMSRNSVERVEQLKALLDLLENSLNIREFTMGSKVETPFYNKYNPEQQWGKEQDPEKPDPELVRQAHLIEQSHNLVLRMKAMQFEIELLNNKFRKGNST